MGSPTLLSTSLSLSSPCFKSYECEFCSSCNSGFLCSPGDGGTCGHMRMPEKSKQRKPLHKPCVHQPRGLPPAALLPASHEVFNTDMVSAGSLSRSLSNHNSEKFSQLSFWLDFICQNSFFKSWESRDYPFIHLCIHLIVQKFTQ